MLDKNVFKQEIEKVIIEFADKNFTMDEKKAAQWYEFMKGLTNEEFTSAVNKLLRTCDRNPSMANLFECIEIMKSPYRMA